MSDVMGALAAQDNYKPVPTSFYDAVGNVAAGLARDIPAAGRWFLDQARRPDADVQADARNVMGGLARSVYDIPEKAFRASEERRAGGEYDAAPIVDAAMLPMGGGLTGVPAKAGEAVLGAGAVRRDPRMWSPISEQKLRKPLDEMEHQYTNVRVPEQKIVDPASLVGGYGLFTPWDLSAANRTVTHIDGTKLQRPVTASGGVGFQEANPGMAAASDVAISRKLDNDAAKLSETGKPVYIMPMTMSETGIDASHHVADPLSQLVKQAPIKADDAAAFNAMMRDALTVKNKDGSIKKVKDWVDTTDPGFEDFITNLKGGMTTKSLMANRIALAEWQKKGFPDVAAIRHAMTEPGLIGVPRNTTGMTVARYTPGQGLLDTTHPSYRSGVAGQYMGQLAQLTPFEVAAPDISKGLAEVNAANKAAGKKTIIQPAYHMGKPSKGVPIAQEFTQEWLDNLMKSWEAR